MGALDEMFERLNSMPDKDREKHERFVVSQTANMKWVPNPGPQTEAYFSQADELFYGGSAGGGKALALDTPLPTPSGWTTMGEVGVGDVLFDEHGKPCNVIATSLVMINRKCYRVTFSDGAEIVADADHKWLTMTEAERDLDAKRDPAVRAKRRAARPLRGFGKRPDLAERNRKAGGVGLPRVHGSVRTTQEILDTLLSARGAINHSVAVAAPIELPDAALPIDPYLFGAWLGDGSSSNSRMTIAEKPMLDLVSAACETHGWGVTKGSSKYDYGIVGGLKVALRYCNTLQNKHIPQIYLRGSVAQRIALLQGLMDTDGYADPRGQCEFTNTNETLSYQVAELIRSLGCKANVIVGDATLYGRVISKKYRIKFMASFPAFRLERKLAIQKQAGFRPTVFRRYIERVEPVDSVPVKCLAIDSPSRLYLAGRDMVPTHNTDLSIGLAITAHERSLILREYLDDARDMAERMLSIIGSRDGWNGQLLHYRKDRLSIDFGGCRNDNEKQRFKGKPHDLIVFDEVSDFLESVYTFIIGWNRSATPNQRCRIIACGNPPTRPEGLWVIKRWAAWLDPKHPNPAVSGELRWYIQDEDGIEREVDGRGPHMVGNEEIYARSRTFIRARLEDNPDLAATDYDANLAALPPELRAAYRDGKFDASLKDSPHQCIPTMWVKAAQERWDPRPPADVPMCALAVDASGGGDDPMMIAKRYDGWYAPLVETPGRHIPMNSAGAYCAGIVLAHRRDNADVIVDMGGGYGGPMYEHLRNNDIEVKSYKGAESTIRRSRDGKLRFVNKRTAAYWAFREALDPGQPGGSPIQLPDDATLVSDLTAPTFDITPNGIKLEPKEKVCERLGRSTDRGDAVVMAWFEGPRETTSALEWADRKERRGGIRNVVLGGRKPLTAQRRAA